jgi:asparagine synthase (glutamine-hydrolysing)
MSMASSLEVRSPLLDHVFVEWAASLAPKWRMRVGQPKYALKKVAEKLGIPSEVLYRPKQGFALPLVHWFREQLADELPLLLLDSQAVQRGYFEPKAVRRILDEHSRARFDHSGLIWQLLIFELWHRNFLASAGENSRVAGAAPILGAGTRC